VLTCWVAAGADSKARELVELLETVPFIHDGREMYIGAAWGAYPLEAGRDAESAMAEADAAMYARKQDQKRQQDTQALKEA
jgi:hypothetical protein